MYEAKYYRLENDLANGLIWLLNEAEHDVSGMGAQCYAAASAGTLPERLLLQERLVSFTGGVAEREAEILANVRRMVQGSPRGAEHWAWLKMAYGPMSRKDPHREFGRELAPIVRHTRAARQRAERSWPHWHMEKHRERYARMYAEAKAAHGRYGALVRMLEHIPDEPPAHELGSLIDEVVDRCCAKLREAVAMGQVASRDGAFVQKAGAEADRMLGEASEAYAAAVEAIEEDARLEGRRQRAEEKVEKERAKTTCGEAVAILARMLENWPGRGASAA